MNVNERISRLVKTSLVFHNINKLAESQLGLSLVQYHVLHMLRDMPCSSLQRLATLVGMHPSTLTQTMKRLVKKDYLFVSEDPKDSRKKILTLTLPGHNGLKRFEAGINKVLDATALDATALRALPREY